MANFVTNRIRLIGNQAIVELGKEINRRFNDDAIKSNDFSDTTAVGRILYGLTGSDASLSDQIEAKWVHVDGCMDEDEPLRLISGWRPVFEIQNHILNYASKLDPNVIVYLEYYDEMPNFIGVRYVLIDSEHDGVEYLNELDTTSYKVVFNDDYEDVVSENEVTGEYEQVLEWEGLWEILADMKTETFKAMQAEHPAIKDNQFNNW